MVQVIEREIQEKEILRPEEVSEPSLNVEDSTKTIKNQLDKVFRMPDGLDSMKKRARRKILKKWKNNIDYYYTHLDKFPSGFED
jgi:hypothetical protein